MQGRGVSGSPEATIPETEITIQGYSNYSRGSIQIPLPNTNRVGRLLLWPLQKLGTRHYHNSHCLAESRQPPVGSTVIETSWKGQPGLYPSQGTAPSVNPVTVCSRPEQPVNYATP